MKIGTPLLWLMGAVAVSAVLVARCVAIANFHGDTSLHSIDYVFGGFHYGLSLLTPFAAFAAIYSAMKYLFRARYSEALGWIHFWTMFLGSLMILTPPLWLERGGAAISDPVSAFAFWTDVATAGYLLTLVSLIFFIVVVVSAFRHRHRPAEGAIET